MSYIFTDEATAGAIRDKYEIGKELGTGTFSSVRIGKERSTGRKVAVKIIDKANVDVNKESLIAEVQILERVKHPNIVNLLDVFESPRKVYLVMELATGGELFDRIVNVYPNGYSEKDASGIIRKIISATAYLHEMDIVHRDLKPENLLFAGGHDESNIKITDFGLAKIMCISDMLKTACGTPSYVAPEVLLNNGYDKSVDLWSVGVITYILLCGFPPFYSESTPELFDQIIDGDYSFPDPYWTNISASAKDLIQKLLTIEPARRITAPTALNHPWIKGTTAAEGAIPDITSNMIRFNAKRKFKMGVEAVMATIRMKTLLKK